MKVAIIHYWFITRRGGEKVVESILKLYPNADIYTLFYNENKYGDSLKNYNIYTSILNIPFLRKYYQKLMSKEILIVNSASAGAVGAWMLQIEAGLAIVVLLTALFINVRNISFLRKLVSLEVD